MVRQLWSTLVHGRWCSYYIQIISFLLLSADTFAREVTGVNGERKLLLLISIHTSTREVTHCNRICQPPQMNFNPHFHKGSDISYGNAHMGLYPFQSTLPQGKWPAGYQVGIYANEFQSTLPQGKWHLCSVRRSIIAVISIHTSTREVTIYGQHFRITFLFQSTLPQGKWHQYWKNTRKN